MKEDGDNSIDPPVYPLPVEGAEVVAFVVVGLGFVVVGLVVVVGFVVVVAGNVVVGIVVVVGKVVVVGIVVVVGRVVVRSAAVVAAVSALSVSDSAEEDASELFARKVSAMLPEKHAPNSTETTSRTALI